MEYNFGIFLLQIDFLYGISLSVGRRFRLQCSIDSAWPGQLEKQDIILLTTLIRAKTGDSLYNQIGEEQAKVQIPKPKRNVAYSYFSSQGQPSKHWA